MVHPRKIYVGYNSSVFRPGCYIQGEGTIRIGNNVQVAQNVGIVSTNHDLYDLRVKHPEPIVISDDSWIGMNAVILAGVTLGPRTIVGAGAVVTKSFPEGNVVIAGNPARVIKELEKKGEKDKEENLPKFLGVIPEGKFERERHRYIDI